MRVTVKLPAPHGEKQRQIIRCLADPSPDAPRFIWVPCGTKAGKTWGASVAQINAAMRRRQGFHRWVAPAYKTARIGMRYARRFLPGPPFVEINKSEGTIAIPRLETVVEYIHGKDPETTIEGEAVHSYVLDEASKLEKQVWDSCLTTMTQTFGRALIISTPRGRNWFYKGCMRAKEMTESALARGEMPRELFITAPTAENPTVPRASIAEAKRLLPDRLFRQYYLAEFLEDGATFTGFDRLVMSMDEYERDGPVEMWLASDHRETTIVAGTDWAKKADFTVCTAWDYSKRPFRCVGFLRFNEKPYTEAVTDVVRFLRKFKRCELLLHDKTGLGEVINDVLACIPGLSYRGVTFTNQTKSMMANRLIAGVERREIIVPNWPAMLHEFNVFEVSVNDLGTMRYSHPDGDHDDIVWSAALGYVACEELGGADPEVKIIEDAEERAIDPNSLEGYIRGQIDDLDADPDEGF